MKVEWHASEVPLEDLNATAVRRPIRTDVIPDAPVLIAPGGTASVNVPEAPPGALFAVLVHKVGTSPTLSGPDVTTDFLEFPVDAAVDVPALGVWQVAFVALLLVVIGAHLLARRSRGRV